MVNEEKIYLYVRPDGSTSDQQNTDDSLFKIEQDILVDMYDEVNNHNSKETIKILEYKETGEPYIFEYPNPNYDILLINELRKRREVECFSIINRGKLWYDALDTIRLGELNQWYNDWLDVTETMSIPERPTWLI